MELPHGNVTVQPDHLEVLDDGAARTVRVRRLRMVRGSGRAEREKGIYALYHAAAAQAYPDAAREIQVVSLVSDDVEDIVLGQNTDHHSAGAL